MREALNISKHDAIGRRFNNLDAHDVILRHGWRSRLACWSERTESKEVVACATGSLNRSVTSLLARIGRISGNVNGYYANASAFMRLPFYVEADLLHFHIVHEDYLSPADWIRLAGEKPVVWTWHDPYMMNGHCIYPLGCDRFEIGCPTCPNLKYHFAVHRDRSAQNLREKVEAVKRIDPLVVVASDYMREIVERSLYRDSVRLRVLPFGVEAPETFDPAKAKLALGVPPGNVVVGFRAVWSDYKGLPLVLHALRRFKSRFPTFPLTILTFQEKGLCADLAATCQVIDVGWVWGREIGNYYAAMDFFLMPSKAEAFGLMAIEAMAAGACPVVTYGTALEELVGAPSTAVCAMYDEEAFSDALEAAILRSRQHARQRDARVAYAAKRFSMDAFGEGLGKIYDEEYDYRNGRRRSA